MNNQMRHPPETVDAALLYATEIERIESDLRTWSDDALGLLAAEVERLRLVSRDLERAKSALAGADDELSRFRAALPKLVGCARGDFLKCRQNAIPRDWELLCCRARAVAVEYGLLSQSECQSEPGDGA